MTHHFEVYENGARERVAIRRGFYWGAALLHWVWMAYHRLWVEAGALFVTNALGIYLLYLGGASWPANLTFQLALGVGVGLAGRHLRQVGLERRGYAYRCTIDARDAAGAVAKLAAVGGVPLPEWRARRMFVIPDVVPRDLRGLAAVAQLTLKSAMRFRLVVVLLILLLAVVILLPVIIKHDGSAQGFTQILITYTLTSITGLLGFSTLWLACGTLARDVEDATMQVVCTKPVPRWQVWMGKWTGIMLLNLAFLAVTGATLYVLLYWKASSLSPAQQQVLRSEVLVARGGLKEPPVDHEKDIEELYQKRLKENAASIMDAKDRKFLRDQIREGFKAGEQYVPPGEYRIWRIPFGSLAAKMSRAPLQLRVKYYSPDAAGSTTPHRFEWNVGSEDRRPYTFVNSFGPESPTTFPIGTNLLGADGILTIMVFNLNERAVLFPLEDGLEVLYPEGGFLLNYIRGFSIIACWLGLLAAIGLFAASKLQFSVSAFVSLGILVVGLSSGTLKQVVEQRGIVGIDHETGQAAGETFINRSAVALYGTAQKLIELITGYDPVDALSTGRSITWGHLAQAVLLVVGVAGGLFAGLGIWIFTRRELAAPI
jgi:ABC-type transport system involved in multi-copper enzyme maturation permease subunit